MESSLCENKIMHWKVLKKYWKILKSNHNRSWEQSGIFRIDLVMFTVTVFQTVDTLFWLIRRITGNDIQSWYTSLDNITAQAHESQRCIFDRNQWSTIDAASQMTIFQMVSCMRSYMRCVSFHAMLSRSTGFVGSGKSKN